MADSRASRHLARAPVLTMLAGKGVASMVTEGFQLGDTWLVVVDELHTDPDLHVPLKRLKVRGSNRRSSTQPSLNKSAAPAFAVLPRGHREAARGRSQLPKHRPSVQPMGAGQQQMPQGGFQLQGAVGWWRREVAKLYRFRVRQAAAPIARALPPNLRAPPPLGPTRNVTFVLKPDVVPVHVVKELQPNLAVANITKPDDWNGTLTPEDCTKIERLGEVRRLVSACAASPPPTSLKTTAPPDGRHVSRSRRRRRRRRRRRSRRRQCSRTVFHISWFHTGICAFFDSFGTGMVCGMKVVCMGSLT